MLEMSQGAAQLLDFVLVCIFLALGQFERFKDSFHVIERFAQRFYNLIDLLNCALNGSRRGGVPWRRWERLDVLYFRRTFRFRCGFPGRTGFIRGSLLACFFSGLRRRFLGF
jgi:hypothetical protein